MGYRCPGNIFLRANDQAMRYIGKDKAESLQDTQDFINLITHSLNYSQGITWAICLSGTNTLIGYLGFWHIMPEHYRAEIGYMLHPDYWRKNLMSEALTKILTYGFKQLNLHSVEANADPENTSSIRLLEKHGFIREGYFRENYRVREQFKDTASYSLLNSGTAYL